MERSGVRAQAECTATQVRQQYGKSDLPLAAGVMCETVGRTRRGMRELEQFADAGTGDNELADGDDPAAEEDEL